MCILLHGRSGMAQQARCFAAQILRCAQEDKTVAERSKAKSKESSLRNLPVPPMSK